MECFLFTRTISRREPINRFGKMGVTMHKEGVIIKANSSDEAYLLLEPFNYRKHIKFMFESKIEKTDEENLNKILDLGII